MSSSLSSSNRLPAERRRVQLLDVALRVFAEQGFHVASMNDIADAAGVTKPVLYQHFTSKRSLYLELLQLVGERLTRAITVATNDAGGPREQVQRGIGAYFRFVDSDLASFQLLFGGGTRRDPEFAAEVAKVVDALAEIIAGLIVVPGLVRDQRLLLAHGVVGLAEGTSRHWITGNLDLDPDVTAATVADLAWRGLRGARGDG